MLKFIRLIPGDEQHLPDCIKDGYRDVEKYPTKWTKSGRIVRTHEATGTYARIWYVLSLYLLSFLWAQVKGLHLVLDRGR